MKMESLENTKHLRNETVPCSIDDDGSKGNFTVENKYFKGELWH
jgi:hypothetical protein